MIRFTAVGYRLPTTGAIDVDLDGHWEKNKYGLQLAVDRCVEIIPKTKDGYTYQCFTCDEDFYAFEQND